MKFILYGDKPHPGLDLLAVDTETTGLKWEDDLLGISMAWIENGQEQSCYLVTNTNRGLFDNGLKTGEMDYTEVGDVLGWAVVVVMHNQAFDIRVLYKFFGEHLVTEKIRDTQHLARLTGWRESVALDNLVRELLGNTNLPDWYEQMKASRANFSNMNSSEVSEYAKHDAVLTLRLYFELMRQAEDMYGNQWENMMDIDDKFSLTVAKMVERGIPVNQEVLGIKIDEARARALQISETLARKLHINNPNSPKQVKSALRSLDLYDTTAENLRSCGHKDAELIIEYKQMDKYLSSFLLKIQNKSQRDGYLHARLNPFGTRSFRMSSSDPNAQGLPVKRRSGRYYDLGGIFKTSDQLMLLELDLKQAEVRMATALCGDKRLAEAMEQEDIYIHMSKELWNTEERRQDAKRATLAAVYEIGEKSFAMDNGLMLDDASDILRVFRNKYPGIKRTSRTLENSAKKAGFVETTRGRRLFIEPNGAYYKAFNQLVQSAISELMQSVMTDFDTVLPGRLVLQVHDSLIVYAERSTDLYERIGRTVDSIVLDNLPLKARESGVPFPVDRGEWGA